MQIISFIFIFLVILTTALLFVCSRLMKKDSSAVSVSNWILLIASYLFVIYADIRFAVVLFVLTLVTWFTAKNEQFYKVGIVAAIAVLGFFKYTGFFVDSFSKVFGGDPVVLNIILPLGISFYTFSAISYILDVRRKKLSAGSLKEVALYLAFFPKLTSGPIQKSTDFFKQIRSRRVIDWNSVSHGIQIFVFGMFKKIVLADRLAVFVDQVYDTPMAFGSMTIFLATIAYSLQIYFDFSGYSDMAIGVGKIMGFALPRNFNLPYLSHNVTELWKRWHMTLSSWLQEYLYISLGGNRKGKIRTYINLILTMVIGGIWHGANWTYMIWGLLHGVALAVHKIWMDITGSAEKEHSRVSDMIAVLVTFLFTNFCWIFFRAESVGKAWLIIKRAASFQRGVEQPYMWLFVGIVLLAAGSICAMRKSRSNLAKKTNISTVEGYYPLMDLNSFWGLVVFFVFCGLLLCLAYTGGSAFIYGNY